MPGFKYDMPYPDEEELARRSNRFAYKMAFFLKHG